MEVLTNFRAAREVECSAAQKQAMVVKSGTMYEDLLDELFTAPSETTGREQADITGLIGQYAHGMNLHTTLPTSTMPPTTGQNELLGQ